MLHERVQPLRWLRRNWFVVLVVSFAVALGLGQLWFHRAVAPGPAAAAVDAIGSLAALVVFAVLLLVVPSKFRRRMRDLRYRWTTRAVDRAMRRQNEKGDIHQ